MQGIGGLYLLFAFLADGAVLGYSPPAGQYNDVISSLRLLEILMRLFTGGIVLGGLIFAVKRGVDLARGKELDKAIKRKFRIQCALGVAAVICGFMLFISVGVILVLMSGTTGGATIDVGNVAAPGSYSGWSGAATAPYQPAMPSLPQRGRPDGVEFQDNKRTSVMAGDRVSTFSLDTDRTSYQLALTWARKGYEIDVDSVRAEEWVNAFNYEYESAQGDEDFAIYSDVAEHPLDEDKILARLAFVAPEIEDDDTPLNVTLVLDASGSMQAGARIDIARAAAEAIRKGLREQDRIAVVHFTDYVIEKLTVWHAPPDDRAVRQSIDRLSHNGSTNVQAGLDLGVRMAQEARESRPDAYNYVILMSDGVANVHSTDPFAILESTGDYDESNPLRLITIGVGISNYNDVLLEQLAQHGNGWYRYLDDVGSARRTFARDNWLALSIPFADQTRAQVRWDPDIVENWRILGYENRVTAAENFEQDRKEFAEIPSGAATTVFYEIELTDEGAAAGMDVILGDVEARWVDAQSKERRSKEAVVRGRVAELGERDAALLRLGALIALAADRYGSPAKGKTGSRSDFDVLERELKELDSELGKLGSYKDFAFLLRHIAGSLPEGVDEDEWGEDEDEMEEEDTGYSR